MRTTIAVVVLFAVGLMVGRFSAQTSSPSAAPDSRTFELRTYTTEPGKLEALHARFRDHTMAIFETHGVTNVGYWIPDDTPNTLIYLVAHESREAVAQSWQAFRDDPDWQRALASAVDGPLVANVESVFLTATDYSPIK